MKKLKQSPLFQFLNKKMSSSLLLSIFFISVFSVFLFIITSYLLDNDIFFLIETGREILKRGEVLRENIWTIDKVGLILQQWLYSVLIAFFYQTGKTAGLYLFFFIQFAIFLFIAWKFLDLKIHSFKIKAIAIVFACLSSLYVINLRPQLITMILFLAECYVLEKYQITHKKHWLLALPLIVVLGVNLHGALWIMYLAIFLAYTVPCFYLPYVKDDSLIKECKTMLLMAVVMILSAFINPYGKDVVLYTVYSFQSASIANIPISEMFKPFVLSSPGIVILLILFLFVLCLRLKVLTSSSVNMIVGLTFCSLLVNRNLLLFSPLIFMFLMRGLFFKLENVEVKRNPFDDLKNSFLLYVFIFNFVFLYMAINNIPQTAVKMENGAVESYHLLEERILENYNPDMHIYTGYNCGAFFEFKGFRNVYIDPRAEIYTYEINRARDILKEDTEYALYGFYKDNGTEYISFSDMDKWFKEYDFDYLIVDSKIEVILKTYLDEYNKDYVLIKIPEDYRYLLYAKKELVAK